MKKILLERVKKNFDFRFGVFWLTTNKKNARLEIAAFYKRKLSRASHAAHLS